MVEEAPSAEEDAISEDRSAPMLEALAPEDASAVLDAAAMDEGPISEDTWPADDGGNALELPPWDEAPTAEDAGAAELAAAAELGPAADDDAAALEEEATTTEEDPAISEEEGWAPELNTDAEDEDRAALDDATVDAPEDAKLDEARGLEEPADMDEGEEELLPPLLLLPSSDVVTVHAERASQDKDETTRCFRMRFGTKHPLPLQCKTTAACVQTCCCYDSSVLDRARQGTNFAKTFAHDGQVAG